jgi:hypothetical protein
VFAQLSCEANWSGCSGWLAQPWLALAGPGQRSRGRNLGQTVVNIQEKTERYPRNFIHFKEISIIIIFKMFLHKQMIFGSKTWETINIIITIL